MDEWPSTPGQITVPATAVRVAAAISRAHGHFAALIDADLSVIWGSETIAEMLGVSDPVGLDVLDVVHPEDLEVATSGLSHHVTHRGDYAHYRPEWRPEPFLLRIGGDRDEVLPVTCRYIDHTLQGSHCEVLWWEEGEDHRLAAHDPGSSPVCRTASALCGSSR
jgi:hypothetical protein